MTQGFSTRLRGLAKSIREEVSANMYVAGDAIRVEAQISITNGAVSGKKHVPSKPGEPPKNDTAVLANNIKTLQIGPLSVEVSSRASYAAELEYGTSKMAARPYMVPAAVMSREKVVRILNNATRRGVRKHFRG